MSNDNNNVNNNNDIKLLIENFIKGFEETKTITRNLQTETQANAVALASIRAELNIMQQHTDWLVKAVRDETGNKSVMSRLLIIENDMQDVNEWLKEQKKKEESKANHLDTLASEDHKGKWQLRIALATGCLGFIATIITAILGFYFKK